MWLNLVVLCLAFVLASTIVAMIKGQKTQRVVWTVLASAGIIVLLTGIGWR